MIEIAKFSLDIFKELKKSQDLKDAFEEQLLREIRYNNEVLKEFLTLSIDDKKKSYKQFISLLEVGCYDFLNNNLIVLNHIIRHNDISTKNMIKESDPKFFKKAIQSISTKSELIEKMYLKIKILKSTSTIKDYTRSTKYDYIRRLSRLIEKSLEDK